MDCRDQQHTYTRPRWAMAAMVAASLVMLAGCGGGGGSSKAAGTTASRADSSDTAGSAGINSPSASASATTAAPSTSGSSPSAPGSVTPGDGSLVYVGGDGNRRIFGVSSVSGTPAWSSPTNAQDFAGPYSSAQVVDGVLYASTTNGVSAIDPASGKVLKSYGVPLDNAYQVAGMPTVVGGKVYVYRSDGTLYAFDAATSAPAWIRGNGTGSLQNRGAYEPPTVGDGEVFMPNPGAQSSVCLDATTGAKLWGNNEIYASAAVFSGTLVYVSGYTQKPGQLPVYAIYALDAKTGTQKWTWTAQAATSAPATANGMVYVDQGSQVFALDAATGKQAWSSTVPDKTWSSPTVVNGRVFLTGSEGAIYAFDAATGTAGWSWQDNDTQTSVTVNGDTAYVRDGRGGLHAFDAATGKKRWEHDAYN